jgi:hypothetical protein
MFAGCARSPPAGQIPQRAVPRDESILTKCGRPSAARLADSAFCERRGRQALPSRATQRATESKAIFNALSKRIHRENVELYVLLDEVEAWV